MECVCSTPPHDIVRTEPPFVPSDRCSERAGHKPQYWRSIPDILVHREMPGITADHRPTPICGKPIPKIPRTKNLVLVQNDISASTAYQQFFSRHLMPDGPALEGVGPIPRMRMNRLVPFDTQRRSWLPSRNILLAYDFIPTGLVYLWNLLAMRQWLHRTLKQQL